MPPVPLRDETTIRTMITMATLMEVTKHCILAAGLSDVDSKGSGRR